MKTDLNSLSFRTRNLPERVNQLDNDINMIQSRIQKIRSSRYHSQKGLDQVSQDLARTWGNSSPSIRSYSQEQSSQLVRRQNSLEAQVDGAGSLSELLALGVLISDLTRDLGSAENSISGQMDDYRAQYQTLDRDLRVAEETVANLANTVIAWKNNEHPVLAVKVQDMTNDKQGVLTLTNLRILFEEVGEEVIRRNLLFATEKKTVREVLLDQPIGSIEVIEKGRVGFFKGAGLYIRFKPQTGLDELKIDTSGDEDDQIIHFYNYIVSGEAERELGPIEETQEDHVPVVCPTCSAPYQEEILRGQTSVKCIYCGSVIKV
jgi:DNA-directed RNA polymerase subunit RPC12/RpoP